MASPKITFLFPYRWLTEDKAFLAENIKRMVQREGGQEAYEILPQIAIYSVQISYSYKEPISNFPLTLTQVRTLLKPFFQNGKCIKLNIDYKQVKSKTMLPLCDFQIYFN
jgi:hypothetical protein